MWKLFLQLLIIMTHLHISNQSFILVIFLFQEVHVQKLVEIEVMEKYKPVWEM